MVEKVCVVCGEVFSTKHSRQKCCSARCSRQNELEVQRNLNAARSFPLATEKSCSVCGTVFKPKRASHHLCSEECRKTFKSKAVLTPCKNCGKGFLKTHNRAQTCSEECSKQYKKDQLLRWKEVNSDKVKRHKSSAYLRHRDAILARQKESYEADIETRREKQREKYWRDVESSRAYQRKLLAAYTDEQRNARRERHARWRYENSEHVRRESLENHHRRKRQLDLLRFTLIAQDEAL